MQELQKGKIFPTSIRSVFQLLIRFMSQVSAEILSNVILYM